MPNILNPNEMQTTAGHGWEEILLADAGTFGTSAMIAKRWNIEPNVEMPSQGLMETDTMLYVISGSGRAAVGPDRFELETEDVLWLEPREEVVLSAGENGLSILVGYRDHG